MWGPNSYAWVLMQLATAQAGIILVRRGWPVIPGYAGGHQEGIIQRKPAGPLASEPNQCLDGYLGGFLLKPPRRARGAGCYLCLHHVSVPPEG